MKLETWLARQGITQAELAKLSNVSQPTISRLLNGETPLPSWTTITRLHQATGGAVTANDFFKSAQAADVQP